LSAAGTFELCLSTKSDDLIAPVSDSSAGSVLFANALLAWIVELSTVSLLGPAGERGQNRADGMLNDGGDEKP